MLECWKCIWPGYLEAWGGVWTTLHYKPSPDSISTYTIFTFPVAISVAFVYILRSYRTIPCEITTLRCEMNTDTPAEQQTSTPELGPMAEFGAALDAANERRAEKPAEDTDPKPSTGEQGTGEHGEPPQSTVDDKTRRQQNNLNAQRRIRQSRERRQANTQQRVNELEQRAQELEAAGDNDSAQGLRDRAGDMQAQLADQQLNSFYDRVVDEMGEENADAIVENTLRYSRYVNANEPELLKLSHRPGGIRLLHEWCRRMDVPELRQQWLGMIPAEKQATLMKFYNQIIGKEQVPGNGGSQPQPSEAPKPQVSNAPVPGSGRDTKGVPPEDDFGLLLQQARNRRLNSRR